MSERVISIFRTPPNSCVRPSNESSTVPPSHLPVPAIVIVSVEGRIRLDLKHLGSDVYTARLKVKFESGKTKQKLYRVGVVR